MLMYCIWLENFLCPTFMLRFQNCMPTMCGWRCSHLIQSLGSSSKPHIFIYFKTMLKWRGFIQFQSRFYPSCSQIPKQWLVVSSVIHHQNLFILFIYVCCQNVVHFLGPQVQYFTDLCTMYIYGQFSLHTLCNIHIEEQQYFKNITRP